MDSDPPATALPVNEIFESVQGEAGFTGTPAVFIRLQGCPVACPWCDTPESWAVDPTKAIPFGAMMAKPSGSPLFAYSSAPEIAGRVLSGTRSGHVVITGGEPALYDLLALSGALIRGGRTVQVETSGTHEIRIDRRAFVTVSPKIGMPGGYALRTEALDRADEIKMPVGKPADVERLAQLVHAVRARKDQPGDSMPTIWLQPLSQSPKATALCVEAATANGWRISIQTHKYLGVR